MGYILLGGRGFLTVSLLRLCGFVPAFRTRYQSNEFLGCPDVPIESSHAAVDRRRLKYSVGQKFRNERIVSL